ncbi:MAG: peptidase M15 [Alphaproteobacteria bacterium]|nr:peptidase M15 [Alphaproteobacteria bacterium]
MPSRLFCALMCVLHVAGAALAEPDYNAWLRAAPQRAAEVGRFEAFLRQAKVADVLPADQLLHNATSWKQCHLAWPYSLPPRPLWPHIVATLAFVRDEVVPAIGPVIAESAYRDPGLNGCAGGAPHSAHALFYAVDLVPAGAIARATLISTLCRVHRERGQAHAIGLGFYGGVRFHIDSMRYRLWGADDHRDTSPCLKAPG